MANAFREAEKHLAHLEREHAAGRLDAAAFQASLGALRATDSAGATWQLGADGTWLRWDGAQWVAGDPHGDAFDDLAARFRFLRAQRDGGQIDDAAYAAAAGALRVREADGSEWSVHPDSGAWLRWNGKAWQEAEPPRRGADGRPAVRPSAFTEFEELYRGILEQHQKGAMGAEEFEDRVAKLRLVDEQGAWWQLSPETGGWLRWDGGQWAPAEPPRETTSTVGPARKFAQTVAESTREELKSTAKSLPRMIFRIVLSRAIMFAVSYFAATYLHAYWTGYENNGIRDDGGPWSPWLFLTQSKHGNSYAYIWGMGGMLLGSFVQGAISRGPLKGVIGTLRSPFALISRLKSTGKLGWGAMALGAGAALLVGSRLAVNPQANLMMAVGFLFMGAGKPGYYVARFLYGIVRRVAAPSVAGLKGKVPVDLRVVQMAMVGVSPGFYLASRIPADKLLIFGAALAAVGVWVTFVAGKPRLSQGTAATMLLGGVFGLFVMIVIDWLHPLVAHADDAGKDEFSGNPDDYWKTEGGRLLEHSKPAGEAAAVGSALGTDDTDEEGEEDEYSYSLTLDPYTMTMTESGEDVVRAHVNVSGPDPDECSNQEMSMNAAIEMLVTGNIVDWFTSTVEADSSGATCRFYVEVPEDPSERRGPNIAYITASVQSPRGTITARCRINMEVEGDYAISMDNEVQVKANESNGALYAFVECNDPALDPAAQLEKTRQLAPNIRFVVTGEQATWVGGPGEIEGYVTGDGKEIPIAPLVPLEDVGASPPFSAEVEVSCEVPLVGVLSKGGRIVIDPPDWFIEMVPIKDTLVCDFKDAAQFKVRVIPMDSSKMSLYGGEGGNQLNQYLQVRAEGSNAQYATIEEAESDGEFRTYNVKMSESAAGATLNDPTLQIVAEATLTGSTLTQNLTINLSGKASLEVEEQSVGLRAGGAPVAVHAKIKDGGDLEWGLKVEITGIGEVEPEGPPEVTGKNAFTLTLRGSELGVGDLRPRKGTLTLTGTATTPEGEEITTDPVDVALTLGMIGLSVTPATITLPLDPDTQPATEFRVRVLDYDEEAKTFVGNPDALQNLEMEPWEDGDAQGGANTFVGAQVELAFVRHEGTGPDGAAVWSVKQAIMIPAAEPLDAYRTLRAACGPSDLAALFEVRQKFVAPVDPASAEAELIRTEQENCRKILKYLPEGDLRTRFEQMIERDAKALGAEGLYHLRHQIWDAARAALALEAESYLASARVYQAVETSLDWVNYLCGLIVQGMSSVLVPFPGDFAVGILYQAIPDLVNAVFAGKSAEKWAHEWMEGMIAGAPGMALDVGLGQVANLEKLFMKGMLEYGEPRKAAGMACLIYWEVRFLRYQVTTKPNGDPFSLKESVLNGLRDLAEEIITTGIGHKTKAAMGGDLPAHARSDGDDDPDSTKYRPSDDPPDLAGMPDANVRAAQEIAAKHGVDIYLRPTNPAAKALLEAGAHPKPEKIKMKTINELDIQLGRNPADLGKAGYFDPGGKPARGDLSSSQYNDLLERWKQRKAEFNNYQSEIADLKSKGYTVDDKGVLLHPDGKPFTGDHDVFDVRSKDGGPIPKDKYDAVMADLKKPPFNAQHDGHRQWDYSNLSREPGPDGAASKWEKANTVDTKILDSHATTRSDGKPGESLIRIRSDGNIDSQNYNQWARPDTFNASQQAGQSATASSRHQAEEGDQ
ncbi:MAG: hypothetical protein M9921_08260 [Fimbriimonadaceae bacterium]|nr:hypothetical protein [Fimbriimonadaceae bacterium]